jgi:hypothetical protein
MNSNVRDREFIGQGLAFPFQISARGEVALAAGINDIEQSIRIILGTIPGERVMRPTFGCRAWELLFDPNNAATQALMADYVRDALEVWEPRVNVQQVSAYFHEDQPEAMIVDIEYEVKATHDSRSIVYPFYISAEG